MQSKKAIFPLLVVFFLALSGCTPTKQVEKQEEQPITKLPAPFKSEQVELPKSDLAEATDSPAIQRVETNKADSKQESISELIATRTITHSIANTGVKSSVLLTCMNANPDVDKKLYHNFKLVGETDGTSVYKDESSSLLLVFTEPKDDLLLIQLTMPLDKFAKQNLDGSIGPEGMAAFGRCVKRLGFAIDPSWADKLTEWMGSKIPVALITEEGAKLRYKHLLVSLDTEEMGDNGPYISLSIGIPEKR